MRYHCITNDGILLKDILDFHNRRWYLDWHHTMFENYYDICNDRSHKSVWSWAFQE